MVIENRFALSIRASRLIAAEWEMGLEGVGRIRFCGAGLPERRMDGGGVAPEPCA
jgi:hypothetical protein